MLPPSEHKPMKARAHVLLTAEIYNNEVWEEVVKKFDNNGEGMRIYTITDFAVEMVEVMKATHAEKEKDFKRELMQKNTKIEQLEQQLSFVKAEVNLAVGARDMALKALEEYRQEAEQQAMDRDLIT